MVDEYTAQISAEIIEEINQIDNALLILFSVVVPKGTLSCDCPKCGKEMISEWVKHHNCVDCKEHYTST